MTDEEQAGPPEPLDPEDLLAAQRWAVTAGALGFNDLAMRAEDLEEKAYFRLMRDDFVWHMIEIGANGGDSPFAQEPAPVLVLTVPMSRVGITFGEKDIELMRLCVARHDLKKAGA